MVSLASREELILLDRNKLEKASVHPQEGKCSPISDNSYEYSFE